MQKLGRRLIKQGTGRKGGAIMFHYMEYREPYKSFSQKRKALLIGLVDTIFQYLHCVAMFLPCTGSLN